MIFGIYNIISNIIKRSFDSSLHNNNGLIVHNNNNNNNNNNYIVPHVIIKKILNFVMNHIDGCDQLIRLLKEFTLISNDWNVNVIPKLQYPRLFVDDYFFNKLKGFIQNRNIDLKNLMYYTDRQSQEESFKEVQSLFPIEYLFFKRVWDRFENQNVHDNIFPTFPNVKRLILYIDFELFPEQQQLEDSNNDNKTMVNNHNSTNNEKVEIEHLTITLQSSVSTKIFENIFCLPTLTHLVIMGLPLKDGSKIDDVFDTIFKPLVRLEKLIIKNAIFPSKIISNLIKNHKSLTYLYVSLYWQESDSSQYDIIKELTHNTTIKTFIGDSYIKYQDLVQLLNQNQTLTHLFIDKSMMVAPNDFEFSKQYLIHNQTLRGFSLNSSQLNLNWDSSVTMKSLKIIDKSFNYTFPGVQDLHFITSTENYRPLFTNILIPLLQSPKSQLRLAIVEIHSQILNDFSLDEFQDSIFMNKTLEVLCIRGIKVKKEFVFSVVEFHHSSLQRLECHLEELSIQEFHNLCDLIAKNENLKSLHLVLTLPFDRFVDCDDVVASILENNSSIVNLSIDITHLSFIEYNEPIGESIERLYNAIKSNQSLLSLQFPRLLKNQKILELLNQKLISSYYSPIKFKLEK